MTEKSCAQPAHTPGPWLCKYGAGQTVYPGTTVAEVGPTSSNVGRWWIFSDADEHGDQEADALLIAGAPGLLAVARRARAWIADMMVDELGWPRERVENPPAGSRLHALDEAIAKATGG